MGPFQLEMFYDFVIPMQHVCSMVTAAALWVSRGHPMCS